MSLLRRLGLKRAATLAAALLFGIGVTVVIKSTQPPSVGDLKEVLKARADRLCSAYRITCTLKDSESSGQVQVLIGRRDGASARTVISYGDVPWRLIRRDLGCPAARAESDCRSIVGPYDTPDTGGFVADGFGADGGGPALVFYGPTRSHDPNRKASSEEDEVGVTPLEALRGDLIDFTEPSVLSYARHRGWDDWNDYFDTRDTRPLEPCRPGYRKSWPLKPDGSSSRPAGLRDCLLVNHQ